MGVAINYSGTINDDDTIKLLVDEIKDISITMQWKYNILNDENLHGIIFSPHPKCEPVMLTFHNLQLCSVINFADGIYDANAIKDEIFYTCSTKTQFAGVDTHIALINLLKYISKKYLTFFKVYDEGCYWETSDAEKLKQLIGFIDEKIKTIATGLENMKKVENESVNDLSLRIQQLLREKLK